MNNTVRSHWLFLMIFFLLGSVFLLLFTTGHHHNDLFLRAFILLPLLLLIPKVREVTARSNALVLLLTLVFFILHVSPFVLTMQLHHQGASVTQHPCCMPQAAALATGILIGFVGLIFYRRKEVGPVMLFTFAPAVRTARSPPYAN